MNDNLVDKINQMKSEKFKIITEYEMKLNALQKKIEKFKVYENNDEKINNL